MHLAPMILEGLVGHVLTSAPCDCAGKCGDCKPPSGLGGYLGELGFSIPSDGVLAANNDEADGSLFSFGNAENLASIVPAAFASTGQPAGGYTGEQVVDSGIQAMGLVAGPFTGGLSVAAASAAQAIEHLFHFGVGRHEADIITPQQNTIWQYIVALSQVALNTNDVHLLTQAILNLQQLRFNLLRFLQDPRFKDGRASGQCANTIMPYLDGSCGYEAHAMSPSYPSTDGPGPDSPCMPAGCNGCGNAWPGNFGYGAGLIGALRRGAVDRGGVLPPANDVTQGIGVPTLQFPGTSGAFNVPPQGYTNQNGWVGQNYPVPKQASMFGDTSMLGIAAAVLMGGFLLSRKGKR